MEHLESSVQGVIAYNEVPVEFDRDLHVDFALVICGIPRNQPSHILRVFLGNADISPDTGSEDSSFAGEFMTYNSPEPEGRESAAYSGAPPAADDKDYEIVIDISEAMKNHFHGDEHIDLAMTMTGLDGQPLATDKIEFSKIVVKRSQE